MLRYIGNQFKKPSGFWGRIVSLLMKKRNVAMYNKLIPLLKIKKGDHILEIGYGHGLGIDIICKNYDCMVTGIDFSELMYAESKARNKKHCDTNKAVLDFGNYLEHTYDNESFDTAFFLNVIYFWNNLEKPFRKLYDELKHHGRMCIFMASADDLKKLKFTTDDIFNKYTIDYVSGILQQTGFKNITFTCDDGYYISCEK